jgi:hypothetical protein
LKDYQGNFYKKINAKNIISKIPDTIIANPIDSKKISKDWKGLNGESVIKAVLVSLFTLGSYLLVKKTNVLSYLQGMSKKSNSNTRSSDITKVENTISARKTLETIEQTNSPIVNSVTTINKKDKSVKFEEIKVEEFKDLLEIDKKKNVETRRLAFRRSISVKNPIPDQNVIVEEQFNLTIDGTSVFDSSGIVSLEEPTIPPWLNFLLLNPNPNPTFKGSYNTPGTAYGVVLSGNYAYVADGSSGLQIIEISDPASPTFKGAYNTPGTAYGVALSGNYAYVADGITTENLQIIDISDPSNPTFKGSYDTRYAYGVAVSGNYAYVADGPEGLKIIDISDPANPTFSGAYDAGGVNQAYGVALSGNYAYVAYGSLVIIDISNPSNPTFRESYDTPHYARGVTVFGNYAYVADGSSGLQIIDISNPSNPTFEGSYDTPDNAYGVALFENYAYVADHSSGLQIIDISKLTNPTFKSSYNTPDSARGVTVSGNYAYVADYSSGLQIIALNPDKLTLSGTAPSSTGTYNVDITACNEAAECVNDSFDIIVGNNPPIIENQIPDQSAKINDIFALSVSDVFKDPDNHVLTFSSSLQNNNPLPSWLKFSENYLFGIPTNLEVLPLEVTAEDSYDGTVTDQFTLTLQNPLLLSIITGVANQKVSESKLLEFEVDTNEIFASPESKPLAIEVMQAGKTFLPNWLNKINLDPVLEGTFATTDETKDLVVNDKYAYLADNSQGLKIVDISNPSEMIAIGGYATNAALGIAKSGNLVFVADGSNGLKVLDIRNPNMPTLIGSYLSGDSANNVEVSGKYALVADSDNGLLILDVSSPTPTLTSRYAGKALDVKVVDNHAYIAAGTSGLEIVNITDPTTPTLKGSYQNAISVNGLAIAGNYCYLANDNAGLKVLDVSDPTLPSVIGSMGIDSIGTARGVTVSGKEVYMALDNGGIQIIDITDPTNPTLKSTLDTMGKTLKIGKSGSFLYVADGAYGMKILNVGKIRFSGTPTKDDVGTITIELKANDGTNEIMDTFTIEVEESTLEDVQLFLTSAAGWVSISLATTASVCLSGASLILLTLITVCCKKAKAKKNRERLRERFTDIELEIDDSEYKHKEREIEINATAKNIEEAVDLSDRDTITISVAQLLEEAKSIGKDLINPGVTATHLANVVRSEQFMHLDRESKLEILKAFEVYTGLALIISTARRQTIYERVQEELVKQMKEVKSITPKNDYEMLFEIACIKEALKIIKSNEKDAFELFQSVFKIKETDVLFAGFLRQYKKITKQWYSKLVSMRYISYEAKKDKEKLDQLQEMIPEKGDWKLVYGVVKILGDIALNGETEKIREQAYFGTEGKMGLKDFIEYNSGKEKGKRAIRGEVAKVLYALVKQGESVDEETQEKQISTAIKALEERREREKDSEVKKVLERLEKDWMKEDRKRKLIGGEDTTASSSTKSLQKKSITEKKKISM